MGLVAALFFLGLAAICVWLGYMIRLMQLHEDNPWQKIGPFEKTGETYLLRGEDGQLVEGRWVSARRSAKEFGGNPSDYAGGWLDWNDEALDFTPVAYLKAWDLPA